MLRRIIPIAISLVMCVALSLISFADFEKIKTYEAGQFTDVPATEWYASSVKDAYEFGLMNGNSVSTFNPAGTLTVAEGITIATRINETITGDVIPEFNGANWYDKYVNYAVSKGIMTADQFDGYDLNIKRFEIAQLFSKVASGLEAVNTVTAVPDVALGAEYAKDVLYLYNAGILGGNDEYGTFAPNSYLLRSEISAMAVRIADSSKRVRKTFTPLNVRAFTDSYVIIDAARPDGRLGIPNGWDYDNRFDYYGNNPSSSILDANNVAHMAFTREFKPENEGLLRLELILAGCASTDKGIYISFENSLKEKILEITPVGGVWTVVGNNTAVSTVAIDEHNKKTHRFYVEVDLDKNTAAVIIDNVAVQTVSISHNAVLDRLVLGTNAVGIGSFKRNHVVLTKNYVLDDCFVTNVADQKPCTWELTGDFVVGRINSQIAQDVFSLKAESKAGAVSTAKKSFEAISGNVILEAYALFPEKTDGATVAFTSNGKEAIKFETKNGMLYMGDTMLHDYIPNVWQWLYVEANTLTGKALVKVNGKKKAEIPFDAKLFDGVSVTYAPDKDAVVWFDDFKAYTYIEHADYPEYPNVVESTDYNIGINVCNLWRDNNSSEGWDSVSPFSEFTPFLGYYDEGIRETADWELKWMAEHGIDFMHVCWYCPDDSQKAPIKKMRVSHSALHDGYMNAKYSDLVDFCIMWENTRYSVESLEQFKTYLWPYWKEHYFSDERYARIDNKAVLSVWRADYMKQSFGGTNEGVQQAIDFMNEELKEMGYDGILILHQTQAASNEAFYKNIDDMGFDATYGYHWSALGYSPEHQINANNTNIKASQNFAHHIPTLSVGFNDIGRNNTRDPLITVEDHLLVAQDIKKILSNLNTGTWKDNTLFISTWNEFSEGTYILPCEGNGGFGYLENIRKTFTNDTSDHTGLDAVPTRTQKERICRSYPATHTPIRHYQFEKRETSIGAGNETALSPVVSFDMAKGGASAWQNNGGIDKYATENGVITGVVANGGSIASSGGFKAFKADEAPVITVKAKVGYGCKMTVSFITDTDFTWNDAKKKVVPISTMDGFTDVNFNMSTLTAWKGNIIGLRVGFEGEAGRFEISSISANEIVSADTLAPKVIINGIKQGFIFDIKLADDGDYIVTGEQRELSFFGNLRVFYRWDRFTDDGVLTLTTFDDRVCVFKVGSDKVTVNGVEQPLGFTFKLRDGLPEFHMKKLATALGYKYKMNGTALEIQAATDSDYQKLSQRVENQWEFDFGTDGFYGQHGEVVEIENGRIMLQSVTGTDVAILKNVEVNGADYTHFVVGFVLNEFLKDSTNPCQFYFTTESSTAYSKDKRIEIIPNFSNRKVGEVVEIAFDLRENAQTMGTLTGIRFDPYGGKVEFAVDYVRFEKRANTDATAQLMSTMEQASGLSWEFNDDGNLSGWTPQHSKLSVSEGYLKGVCTGEKADVAVINDKLSYNVEEAHIVAVGVKYNPEYTDREALLFFRTKASSSYSADKKITAKYNVPKYTNPGETIELVFDLAQNEKYYGQVLGLRFDPHDCLENYEIDYIRLYKKSDYVPRQAPPVVLNKLTKPTEAVIDGVEGIPDGIKVTEGKSSGLSIVDNPVNPDEKVFKVSCALDGAYTTYIYVYMQFLAGKTYEIKYSIYPLTDKNGKEYSNTIIGGNFVYGVDGETVTNHVFASNSDKSTGQGWVDVIARFTVADEYNPTDNDRFETWGKAVNGMGIEYLVKDISVKPIN